MAKQVILAVAGAGKTYHICHNIDPKKKNLILGFTHENIHNIIDELINAHGRIPELTVVMTFDSFVYRYMICPYEPTIGAFFGQPDFESNGITTIDPPPQRIKKNGRYISNHLYVPKGKFEHYITANAKYYCANLSELVMQVKKGRNSLIQRASTDINIFFDNVLIDEFQDFREHDYDLITAMAKQIDEIVLVGDYYQHSVSARNNTGKPFTNRSGDVAYGDLVEELKRLNFAVDETTLNKSRRCSADVCRFVQEKLGINIESHDGHDGSVIWLDEGNVETVLNDSKICKLVYNRATDYYPFQFMNWSYSKGDTVEEACVILTNDFENMDRSNFTLQDTFASTRNKLYVAMTRSKGNLYLVKASVFKKFKESYCLR